MSDKLKNTWKQLKTNLHVGTEINKKVLDTNNMVDWDKIKPKKTTAKNTNKNYSK